MVTDFLVGVIVGGILLKVVQIRAAQNQKNAINGFADNFMGRSMSSVSNKKTLWNNFNADSINIEEEDNEDETEYESVEEKIKTKETVLESVNDKPLYFEEEYPHYLKPIKYEPFDVAFNRLAITDDILSLMQSCFTKEYYLRMQDEFKHRNLEQGLLVLARMDDKVIEYKDFAINLLKEYNKDKTFGYIVCAVENISMSSKHFKKVIKGVPFLDITAITEVYGFSATLEDARQIQVNAAKEYTKANPGSYIDGNNVGELNTGFMSLEVLPIPLNTVLPRTPFYKSEG